MSQAANVERDPRFRDWPGEAQVLAETAILAHGGLDAFTALRCLRLSFVKASGLLMRIKGYGTTFPAPREFEILPHEGVTIFRDYPAIGQNGRFEAQKLCIQQVSDGRVLSESHAHRQTFGLVSKYRRWSALDALYFFGYALWHYHTLPFLLCDARFVSLCHSQGHSGIEVEFPSNVPTHSRRQRFYFGSDGRIVRHDYVAEVVGVWARACHFWEGYETYQGLQIATQRRVVARAFGNPTPLEVLRATFSVVRS